MESQILRCPEVMRLTGLSKATLYRAVKAGEFPKPVKLTARAVGWRRKDVEHWLASREPVALEGSR